MAKQVKAILKLGFRQVPKEDIALEIAGLRAQTSPRWISKKKASNSL
jgi:hypothetical protein